jgi:hypothetical protein
VKMVIAQCLGGTAKIHLSDLSALLYGMDHR